MRATVERAPGVPVDYYDRLGETEQAHWWPEGMRAISRALLGTRLQREGLRILDAGCGTGGFLRWLVDTASPAEAAGVDVAQVAIAAASVRIPGAALHVAPLSELPFDDTSFDLVVCNDVLQHVREDEVDASLREMRRVLAPSGAVLLRTNGARRSWRARDDWRAYDRTTLRDALVKAGFLVERSTYANLVASLYAAARGHSPSPPTDATDGIPHAQSTPLVDNVGRRLLRAEARWLARPGHSLPYGHTLFALAVRA